MWQFRNSFAVDFPTFPRIFMGNLRDRPKPIPFASPRRFDGEAVALAASSTKWQEGIECCREPGDLGNWRSLMGILWTGGILR